MSNNAENTVFVDNKFRTAIYASLKEDGEKKLLFEKPRLAEDGTNLVEKYYKNITCGITRFMSDYVTFEKIWVKC